MMCNRCVWPSNKMGNAGSTLMEVMLTITIIAVGLNAILTGFSTCARLASQERRRTEARRLATSQLQALSQSGALARADAEGTFDNGYTWRSRVFASEAESPFTLVTLTILRRDVNRPVYECTLPIPKEQP